MNGFDVADDEVGAQVDRGRSGSVGMASRGTEGVARIMH